MPMDSITSALRSEPSAYCCAPMEARLACASGGCELRSLSQATPVCTMAPATADQPSTGLMAKISTMNTSATGASMIATSTGACKKSRTVRKSFMDCTEPPGTRRRFASKITSNMRPDNCLSSAWPAPRKISLRDQSSSSITAYRPSTSRVSIHSVMWLRLFTTRS